MHDMLEQAKQSMQRPHRTPEEEWAALQRVLQQAGPDVDDILEWVFVEARVFTDTRTKAGAEFLKRHPKEGWRILEQLITSQDPDDRDAALTLLSLSGDSRAPELAKPLLHDQYTYLQFDAIDFLHNVYPAEVTARLQVLAQHEDAVFREAAQERLHRMKQDM